MGIATTNQASLHAKINSWQTRGKWKLRKEPLICLDIHIYSKHHKQARSIARDRAEEDGVPANSRETKRTRGRKIERIEDRSGVRAILQMVVCDHRDEFLICCMHKMALSSWHRAQGFLTPWVRMHDMSIHVGLICKSLCAEWAFVRFPIILVDGLDMVDQIGLSTISLQRLFMRAPSFCALKFESISGRHWNFVARDSLMLSSVGLVTISFLATFVPTFEWKVVVVATVWFQLFFLDVLRKMALLKKMHVAFFANNQCRRFI